MGEKRAKLRETPPGNAGSTSVENGFDEQSIVGCSPTHMAFAAGQKVLDPIPLVVALADCRSSRSFALTLRFGVLFHIAGPSRGTAERQQLENTLENSTLRPSTEALMHDLPTVRTCQ